MPPEAAVGGVSTRANTTATDAPEADGTAHWDGTTIIVVTAATGGSQGPGYACADAAIVKVITGKLARVIGGRDAMDPPGWRFGCTATRVRHLGWFDDHVRSERMLFDGAPVPEQRHIVPDWRQAGLGLGLKQQDAERFEVGAG